MDADVTRAIARIDIVQQGSSVSRGTGFLVAPDLVLTAFHVVADRTTPRITLLPGRIALTFRTDPTDATLTHTTHATVVDGRADPRADWILLRCETPPADVYPIALADEVEDGAAWETYGFPDANPRDGMAQLGSVEHAGGTFDGVPAYQLFSRQAAAGMGAPVKGLSGGPVIVEGAVVGLLRSSLMKDGQNVAGTLYACPVDLILERCSDLLARRRLSTTGDLPETPFRFLQPFTAAHAEVFFGREREIDEFYQRLIGEGPRVVLLYGQSGAGKSSFLEAGVLPRLVSSHTTLYRRRDSKKGLLTRLADGVRSLAGAQAITASLDLPLDPLETLRVGWLAAEAASGKPLVAVLDQIEEMFSSPGDDPDEVSTLFDAVAFLFQPGTNVRGKLVLGFRKEWLAEIRDELASKGIEKQPYFLKALDHGAVVEIVTGLCRTKRLRDRYRLNVDPELPAAIARDLSADRDSPVAPVLQVLLSRLWRLAKDQSESQPCFTLAMYEQEREKGFLLKDFLDQQLSGLEEAASHAGGSRRDVVSSGLALDVLMLHTSPFSAAEEHSLSEIETHYSHRRDDVRWLVQELKRLYLLTDSVNEWTSNRDRVRLAHDELAKAVRAKFENSDARGQRARRILENRAGEWADARSGTPLDTRDLALVEQGLAGMRAVRSDEERLLEASRAARDTEEAARRRGRRVRRRLVAALILAFFVVVGLLGLSYRALHQRAQALSAADLREAQNAAARRDTPTALAHLARALRLDGDNALARAWAFDYLTSVRPPEFELRHQDDVRRAAFSSDGTHVLSMSEDGTARVWDLATRGAVGVALAVGAALHPQYLRAVSFSADLARVVTVAEDGKVQWWDARTGQAVGSALQLSTDDVWSAAFSPDGTRLVTQNDAFTTQAYLWDTHTGQAIGEMLQHDSYLSGWMRFSADGTQVVTVSGGETAWVWNGRTGRAASRPLKHHQVAGATFSADGTRVVTASVEGTVQVWDVRTGQAVGAALQHIGGVILATLSPDGTRLVTMWSDTAAQVRDVRTGQAVGAALQHAGAVYDAAFSPDGTRVVTASDDGARVWDARTGAAVGVPWQHEDADMVAFSADGKRVLTRSGNAVRVWDPRTSQALAAPLQHHDAVTAAAFSGDGTRVVTASRDRTARVWNAQTGAAVGKLLKHQGMVGAATSNVDGTRVVTASDRLTISDDATLQVWDVLTATAAPLQDQFPNPYSNPFDERSHLGPSFGLNGVVFSEGGTWVLTSYANDLWVWDARTKQAVGPPLQHDAEVRAAAFSPDGTRVVTASDRTVRVWNARTGRAVGKLLQHQDTVFAVAFSADGTRVLTASRNAVRLWDARTSQAVGDAIPASGSFSLAAAFSPNGTHHVTTSSDAIVQVRDVLTGQLVGTPLQHQDSVTAAAFSPDGTRVVTASGDTARLWDARTGQAVGAPLRHQKRVNAAAFSTDGTRVLTASDDGTARVWDAQVGTRNDSSTLADLAEVLGGVRLSPTNALEPLPERNGRLTVLRQQGSGAEPGDPGAAAFVRWVFDDPWTRFTSPLSKMTVDEYIERMLALGDAGRAEAERVFLGHPRLNQSNQQK